MGTHPIFESDFDCLTDLIRLRKKCISPSKARASTLRTPTRSFLSSTQSLQIFTELSIETVGNALAECTVLPVLLSIEEPVWDLVLTWVEHDSFHTFDLIIVELTSSL